MKQGCNASKGSGSGGGLQAEQKREYKDLDKYKNDIDFDKSHLNVVHDFSLERDWTKRIKKQRLSHEQSTGKKLRKDAVTHVSLVETCPKSWGRDLSLEYFKYQEQVKLDLLKKHGVEDTMLLSSITHFDEKNPHNTLTFMPFKNGKFQCKNIVNQVFLRELGKELWRSYQEFEKTHDLPERLDEPQWDGGKKHLKDLEYKIQQTNKQIDSLSEAIETRKDKLLSLDETSVKTQILDLEKNIDYINQNVKDSKFSSNKTISKSIWDLLLQCFSKIRQIIDYVKKLELERDNYKGHYIQTKRQLDNATASLNKSYDMKRDYVILTKQMNNLEKFLLNNTNLDKQQIDKIKVSGTLQKTVSHDRGRGL